ncbi:MAG: HNH endonuclease [Lachnospiraceae bacterium]
MAVSCCRDAYENQYYWSNLIALCKSCHSQIHVKRGNRWG